MDGDTGAVFSSFPSFECREPGSVLGTVGTSTGGGGGRRGSSLSLWLQPPPDSHSQPVEADGSGNLHAEPCAAGFSQGPGRQAWWGPVLRPRCDTTWWSCSRQAPAFLLCPGAGRAEGGRELGAGLSQPLREAEQSSRLKHPQAITGRGLVSSCPSPAGPPGGQQLHAAQTRAGGRLAPSGGT